MSQARANIGFEQGPLFSEKSKNVVHVGKIGFFVSRENMKILEKLLNFKYSEQM